jgi:hypothetical protein
MHTFIVMQQACLRAQGRQLNYSTYLATVATVLQYRLSQGLSCWAVHWPYFSKKKIYFKDSS